MRVVVGDGAKVVLFGMVVEWRWWRGVVGSKVLIVVVKLLSMGMVLLLALVMVVVMMLVVVVRKLEM